MGRFKFTGMNVIVSGEALRFIASVDALPRTAAAWPQLARGGPLTAVALS